jgi:hypothetical protein
VTPGSLFCQPYRRSGAPAPDAAAPRDTRVSSDRGVDAEPAEAGAALETGQPDTDGD